MKKYILLLIAIAALCNTPTWAMADTSTDIPEVEEQQPVINVVGSRVHVSHASGQTLEIFDVAGVCVATLRIDTEDKTFNLNLTKGCYILKVGKVVRKISIR